MAYTSLQRLHFQQRTMMAPLDSPDRRDADATPQPQPPASSPETAKRTASADRDMIFFRRPDLHARQLFFQNNSSATRRRADVSEHAIPVQLVDVDGRTHLGMPAAATRARTYSEVTVDPSDARRQTRENRLSRLVVTSDVLNDASTTRRLRLMKYLFVGTAVANIVLTISLLFPSDSDAWFYVDGFGSTVGPAHLQRLMSNRAALLILASIANAVGITAVILQKASILTVYMFGTVVSDVWTLTVLLPHAFFLLRLLFDVLLVLLAAECRSYLVQPWFVTNFHRLRY